ncbi:GTPase LSG1-2-like protein [Drosera capensis]
MGKNEKTGLGRALVKHHNQMVQQSKEKGSIYRSSNRKNVLESVTDVNDIDAVIEHAEEEERLYAAAAAGSDPIVDVLIDLDRPGSSAGAMTPEEWRKQQKEEEALHATSLRVPRRPPWNAAMSIEELDANERQAFLIWRRSLAKLEENEKLVLTPFEKNLDIWRQLWRVVERSDLLVMVVDGRDPLFYRCPDLEVYAQELDVHKKTMLLVNKADLLPHSVRVKWANYFRDNGILFVFWSAKAASAALQGNDKLSALGSTAQELVDADAKIYGRDELLARLQSEAEEWRRTSGSNTPISSLPHPTVRNGGTENAIVGFVGYPNVGKSSTINALVGQKRTGVTSTPGKTKHFQTLIISDKLTLCDCPGLVFPSFSSSRHEMIACGVLPIDRMTAHRDAVQVVANRVPRHVIAEVYNITLPKPKPYEPQSRPPLASELLRAYCASRGYVGSSGLPDETRAARQILKDYMDGKLPHFELPPDGSDDGASEPEASAADLSLSESGSSDIDDGPLDKEESASISEDLMDHLDSFDMENGQSSGKARSKEKPTKSHKHHKKPQRKKDRSWRAGNDGGDGTPVVRVFQKTVNTGPSKVQF